MSHLFKSMNNRFIETRNLKLETRNSKSVLFSHGINEILPWSYCLPILSILSKIACFRTSFEQSLKLEIRRVFSILRQFPVSSFPFNPKSSASPLSYRTRKPGRPYRHSMDQSGNVRIFPHHNSYSFPLTDKYSLENIPVQEASTWQTSS